METGGVIDLACHSQIEVFLSAQSVKKVRGQYLACPRCAVPRAFPFLLGSVPLL